MRVGESTQAAARTVTKPPPQRLKGPRDSGSLSYPKLILSASICLSRESVLMHGLSTQAKKICTRLFDLPHTQKEVRREQARLRRM